MVMMSTYFWAEIEEGAPIMLNSYNFNEYYLLKDVDLMENARK